MFNWIYEHVINTVYFPWAIVAFLVLVLFVSLFIDYKDDEESNKQQQK
jgi:hypothetical protein